MPGEVNPLVFDQPLIFTPASSSVTSGGFGSGNSQLFFTAGPSGFSICFRSFGTTYCIDSSTSTI